MNRAELGQALALLRNKKGLTLMQIEEATGINYSHVAKIEKGQVNITIDSLLKILDTIGGQIIIKKV